MSHCLKGVGKRDGQPVGQTFDILNTFDREDNIDKCNAKPDVPSGEKMPGEEKST